MTTLLLLASALGLSLISGFPALFLKRGSKAGQRTACALMCLSSAAGLTAAFTGFAGGPGIPVPADGSPIGMDALSAFFLVPVFLMGALGSLFGMGYWPADRHPDTAGRIQLFWGILIAGMALLVVAKRMPIFLIGWEVMALAAFVLVSAEDHIEDTRRSSWIYFISAHAGTLALFGLFAGWHAVTGSFAIEAVPRGAVAPGGLNAMFLLILVGFGLKAGIMPFHFWLPAAHANASSHVSAVMSAVVLKMGVYGIVRFVSLLPDPPAAWGTVVLLLGAASALLGVVFALAQHDIKRLLAYHSVENIGIIFIGLGLALLGRSAGRPEWVLLGLAGGLLHVWNHSFFKGLLFLSAGSVVRATGTRRIDRLGGLAKTMPWTAAFFVIGAAAISGLPPLNGFISEFFLYVGLFGTGTGARISPAVLAVPVLAMVGALAAACFVKAYGALFLGTPRDPSIPQAREATFGMKLSMALFAILCVLIGVAPAAIVAPLEEAVAAWQGAPIPPETGLREIVPLGALSLAAAVLAACIAALAVLLRPYRRSLQDTWDCGYARPSERMQYTASSFAQPAVRMFAWALRPREHRPRIAGPFPAPARMESHVNEIVLDRVLIPAAKRAAKGFAWFRRFQQGLVQSYLLYIFVALGLLLCTLVDFEGLLASLFPR